MTFFDKNARIIFATCDDAQRASSTFVANVARVDRVLRATTTITCDRIEHRDVYFANVEIVVHRDVAIYQITNDDDAILRDVCDA